MARVIGYTRFPWINRRNTDQAWIAQRESIEKWAGLQGHTLAEVFTDAGISGAKAKRRGINQSTGDLPEG
jgi:hypothetical protein